MKIKSLKSLVTLIGLLLGMQSTAQSIEGTMNVKPLAPINEYRTLSVGVYAGSMSSYTIFHGKDDWNTAKVNLGYGAYIKEQLLHSFAIQANFFRGQLEGSGNTVTTSTLVRYKTNINYAADLSAVVTFANISWGNRQNLIQPYATGGGGFIGYVPEGYNAAGVNSYPIKGGKTVGEFYIPIGLGIKFNVTDAVNVDLGYQVNFNNNDNLDGLVTGATFDKFSYGHIGLEFSLGDRRKPQLAIHNPVAAMRAEYLTETADLRNVVESQVAKNAQLRSDLILTTSNLDAATTTLNAINAKLNTDSDGDGVPDLIDKCRDTPVGSNVDGAGCPVADSKTLNTITDVDRKIVRDATADLEFYTGGSVLRQTSFPILDKVAELMMTKGLGLKLACHTDDVGPDTANMILSKSRAEAVKSYLVVKGANPSRIEASGYGKTQPIASNKTAAGRKRNNRVEFTLYQ